MRKFFAAAVGLALACGLVLSGPGTALAQGAGSQQVTCNKVAFVASVATGTTAQVVPLSSGQTISICGIVVSSVAASTAQLQYGTGTNCGTGTTPITAPVNFAASTPLVYSSPFAFFSAPQGAAVCVTVGGTGPVGISISYAQF